MNDLELLMTAVEQLQGQVRRLQRQVARLQRIEAAGGGPVSEANVSNPPTAAQLTTVFGSPANISEGMIKFVNDNGAETAVYLVVPIESSWWIFTAAKAV